MFASLKRHPVPVVAYFRHSLVLTYALPADALRPYVPPGLELDTYDEFALLAIALVQTEGLRPAFLPVWMGQSFFLAGFRVFVRFKNSECRTLRGLRILRSYADRRAMVVAGNCLTHYNYRLARVRTQSDGRSLAVDMVTAEHQADLDLRADLTASVEHLPANSPFRTMHDARRFAGPLPFTFDYEPQTHSIILIEGRRTHWEPRSVNVEVRHNAFIERGPFAEAGARLANAFYVRDVPYRWERGLRQPLVENA